MATTRRTPKRSIPDIVIDINSSPDPEPTVRTRSSSRTRPVSSHQNAKGKGKVNAGSQSNNVAGKRIMGPVIELTDSDSETGPVTVVKPNRAGQKYQHNQVQAGPSRPKPFPMHVDSSNSAFPTRASSENLPTASSSSSLKRKDRDPAPLFLTSQSDEENDLDERPGPSIKKKGFHGHQMDNLFIENDSGQERQHVLQHDHEQNEQPSVAPAHRTPTLKATPVTAIPQSEAQNPVALPMPNAVGQGMNPVEVEPIPEPEPETDPTSQSVAQVLEVVPDVEPDYVLGLVITHLPNFAAQTAEHIIGLLFEDGGYPKIDKKGKRKAIEPANENGEGPSSKRVKIDYAVVDRPFTGGPLYEELSLVQLQISFPLIPKAHLRRCLHENRGFYAPTHLAISAMEKQYPDPSLGPRPYVKKATRFNSKRDLTKYKSVVDEAFAQERRWLVDRLQDPNESNATTVGAPIAGAQINEKDIEEPEEDEPPEDGTGIECQCCFSEYSFDKMVQCPETHLFCSSCVSQYAATKLGEHNPSIICMHSSGCAQPFPTSELRRVLSPKLMELYERVKQQKEIQEASLDGLEECPFCEWKCVIETPVEQEKLFRCGNEEGGCGEVSCRLCKKKDHLPKSCKEVEEDKLLDGRHAIEEAMTRALMRNCPKCQKAFVKEAGCNKMTCPNCHTLSCYVCRKVITGYEHFNQAPPGRASTSKSGGKCLLWDNVEERHATEVKAAAERAAAEYKREHPNVDDKDIKVDIPTGPKPPQAPHPDPRLNRPMLQPGPHVQWNQGPVPVNFGIANHNPFAPDPLGHVPAQQRRQPIRGQHQPQILQPELEQRYLEQQRRLEEERMMLRARLGLVRQQAQERQRAIRLENQQHYNQVYQQHRVRLEQQLRERQEARLNHLEAQIEHDRALQQQAQPLLLAAPALANVHAQRAVGAVFPVVPVVPAPAVHGAAGNRRRRRG